MQNGSHLVVESPDDLFHLGLDEVDLDEFGLNIWISRMGQEGIYMYNISDGEYVFRYIVLKFQIPFMFMLTVNTPYKKPTLTKGNCEQLNKQLASPGSNPIHKVHTVLGYENMSALEGFQFNFFKSALHLKASTPKCMVYGETGIYPIDVLVKKFLDKNTQW